MAREQSLVDRIKKEVEYNGGVAVKYQATGQNHAGFPDLIIILKGKTFFVETKAPGKRPTKIQEATMQQIRNAGGDAFWCDSFDEFIDNYNSLM